MENPFDVIAWLRAPAFAPNVLGHADDRGWVGKLSLAHVLFAIFSALAVVLVFSTDTYVVNHGIGDDGMIYAAIVRAFDGNIRALGLNGYTAQRCLNPIAVRVGMDIFKMSYDAASIVKAYKVANAICVVIAIGCCIKGTRYLRVTRAGLLFAVLLSYFNFSTLYFLPFDPVLTDGMAMAIGALQFWSYISRRYVALTIVSAVGGFIWPSSTQIGAALLFFPRPPTETPKAAEVSVAARPIDLAIAATFTAVATWFAGTLSDFVPSYAQQPAVKTLFRLSCILFCLVTFAALKDLIRVAPSLRQLVRTDRDAIVGKVLAVALLAGMSFALRWISSAPTQRIPQAPDFAMSDIFKNAVFFAVQRPLVNIVAHVAWFGPAILLFAFCWKELCDGARRVGFGLNAVLGIAYLMGLNSQSRTGASFSSIVLPLVVIAAAHLPWTPKRLWELAVFTFVASKLWYSIVQRPVIDFSSIQFHIGSWMSNDAYLAQGIGALVLAIWIHWMKRQDPSPTQRIWLIEP